MGKKAHLFVQESLPELQKMLVKRKSLKEEKRVRCLIAVKSGKFETRQEIADNLGIHIRTPVFRNTQKYVCKYLIINN
jgi:hypothetical protein